MGFGFAENLLVGGNFINGYSYEVLVDSGNHATALPGGRGGVGLFSGYDGFQSDAFIYVSEDTATQDIFIQYIGPDRIDLATASLASGGSSVGNPSVIATLNGAALVAFDASGNNGNIMATVQILKEGAIKVIDR